MLHLEWDETEIIFSWMRKWREWNEIQIEKIYDDLYTYKGTYMEWPIDDLFRFTVYKIYIYIYTLHVFGVYLSCKSLLYLNYMYDEY